MQTAELKTFEKMSEGIALFNEDGSFDYINEAGGNWLWGLRDDDDLYDEIAGIVNRVVCGTQRLPVKATLKNVKGNYEIKCEICRANSHILVVLAESLDNKPHGFGIGSSLDMIRDKLCLMNSVYVGGRLILVQENL